MKQTPDDMAIQGEKLQPACENMHTRVFILQGRFSRLLPLA